MDRKELVLRVSAFVLGLSMMAISISSFLSLHPESLKDMDDSHEFTTCFDSGNYTICYQSFRFLGYDTGLPLVFSQTYSFYSQKKEPLGLVELFKRSYRYSRNS